MLGTIKNIFKPEKIVLNNGKEIQPKTSVTPFVIIGLTLALIVAGNVTGFNFETIMKKVETLSLKKISSDSALYAE